MTNEERLALAQEAIKDPDVSQHIKERARTFLAKSALQDPNVSPEIKKRAETHLKNQKSLDTARDIVTGAVGGVSDVIGGIKTKVEDLAGGLGTLAGGGKVTPEESGKMVKALAVPADILVGLPQGLIAGGIIGGIIGGTGLNKPIGKAIQNLPQIAQTGIEVAGYAGGLNLKNMFPKTSGLKPLSERGKLAQEIGAPATQAAEAVEYGKIMPGSEMDLMRSKERIYKSEAPTIQEAHAAKQQEWANGKVKKIIDGEIDVNLMGQQVKQGITKFENDISEMYSGAQKGFFDLKASKGLGNETAKEVYAYMQKLGIPFDKKGNVAVKQFTDLMGTDAGTAQIMNNVAEQLNKVKTFEQLTNLKRNFSNSPKNKDLFSDNPGRASAQKNEVRRMLVEAEGKYLGDTPEVQDYKNANKEWANYKEMEDITSGMKENANELVTKGLSNADSVKIKTLKTVLGEDLTAKAGFTDLMEKSIDDATKEINYERLLKNFNKIDRTGNAEQIFTSKYKEIKDFINTAEYMTAPQRIQGLQRIGGSQTANVLDIISGGKTFVVRKLMNAGLLAGHEKEIADYFKIGNKPNVVTKGKLTEKIPVLTPWLGGAIKSQTLPLIKEGENK